MAEHDIRVDTYISKANDFAKPILSHLRELVFFVCPNAKETIKWGFPNFEYKGLLCSMAAFKQHCAFNFWKAALMKDAEKLKAVQKDSMGHLGRITSLKDLPADKILISYLKEAVKLNEEGIKIPKKKDTTKKPIVISPEITAALDKNKKAKQTWENFSQSHRKEYAEWIAEAKTEPTKQKRVATMLEWLAEGKGRNWKHQKK